MIVRCGQRTKVGRLSTVAKLSNRRALHAILDDVRIYSVTGQDSNRLMQNLITNDVAKLTDGIQSSAILTPQGRVIGSTFLYKTPKDEGRIFMELHDSIAEAVMAHIKRFKLRSKAIFQDITSEYAVIAHWDGDETDKDALASGKDLRAPEMGFRSIVPRTSEFVKSLAQQGATAKRKYDVHRMILGVAEQETANCLPLEANIDIMKGVDYRKGCYVGQELTARTHHTGIVRKRIMPITLYAEAQAAPEEIRYEDSFSKVIGTQDVRSERLSVGADDSKPSRARSAGKLLTHVGNVGLAMLRLEQAHRWSKDILMHVSTEDGAKVYVKPRFPQWWPEDIRNAREE